MKKYLLVTFISIFLVSCGQADNQSTDSSKKDFIVDTKDVWDFNSTINIKKSGKIGSTQDIVLNSNAGGRIKAILFDEGDKVYAGQTIAVIDDNIGSYGINLSKAKNALDRAKINYDSNKLVLDKTIFDSEISLEKLEINLETLKKDSAETLKKLKDDLDNTDIGSSDSSSSLQVKKLENNISKARLDYETKIVSDEETIIGYKSTLKKEYNSLLILLDDIIEFSDLILGVTIENRSENDKFEDLLGSKDRVQLGESKTSLRNIISYRQGDDFNNLNELLFLSDVLLNSDLLSSFDTLDDGYELAKNLLNNLEQTLNNTINSEGTLSQSTINGYISSINGFQASLQGNFSSYISFSTSSRSFLKTYLDNQKSILTHIDILEDEKDLLIKSLSSSELGADVNYEKTLLSINDSIKSLELQIKTAKNNLQNAEDNKQVTLRSLQNSINDANIGYSQALKEYSKLTIVSPIDGTIGSLSVDVGQEVSIGTMLLSIVSDSNPEVEVGLSKDEVSLISESNLAYINYLGKSYTGSIYSVSSVADENLNYRIKISFTPDTNIIGSFVNVSIPVNTDKLLIPINSIETIGEGEGILKILKGEDIENLEVGLGNIFDDKIEVILPANLDINFKIVTTDMTNFDEAKFNLNIN